MPKYIHPTSDWNNHWKEIFPLKGMCMLDQKLHYAYIPIPRCGSSFLCDYFYVNYKWQSYNYNFVPNKRFFSVIRDPFQRWISGLWQVSIGEESVIKLYDSSLIDKLLENPSLDNPHMMLQTDFFKNLDLSRIEFFNFDDPYFTIKLENYINNVLKLDFTPLSEWNKSNGLKLEIVEFLKKYPDLVKRIKEWLEPDYNFIKKVNYYGTN